MRFTEAECNEIIRLAVANKMQHITNYASDLSTEYTDYNYGGIVNNSESKWLFEKLVDFIRLEHPGVDIEKIPACNIHQFFTGGKFTRHVDVKREPHMLYIVGTTLSKDFTGGKLLAYDPDEELAPVQGQLYGMYSNRPHEVTKVESGERWSLVLFLTREQLGIKKSLL